MKDAEVILDRHQRQIPRRAAGRGTLEKKAVRLFHHPGTGVTDLFEVEDARFHDPAAVEKTARADRCSDRGDRHRPAQNHPRPRRFGR